MEIVYAIVILLVLVGLYVVFSLVNEKTAPPEGCEIPEDFSSCSGCHSTTCAPRKQPPKDVPHDQ